MEWEAPREVRFRILALWLPLFCYASRGTACPVMTGSEKREMETVLDELIRGLPWEDQEVILTNWLEDFTNTDSDWPDLHRCYDHWCRSCRKLLLSTLLMLYTCYTSCALIAYAATRAVVAEAQSWLMY